MITHRAIAFWAVTSAALASFVDVSNAAVRECLNPVAGDLKDGPTEFAAKAAALASWRTKVQQNGENYDAWRIAIRKLLTCAKDAQGRYSCVAIAAPCVIAQRPYPAQSRPDSTSAPAAGRVSN